jgi:D-arabinose 1-dehydrogenase-like Zn-dependent alcohol dehydrogenase
MKAIQITHQQELNIIEIEKPQALGQGEILLKLHYVGFCGSDINTFMGRNTSHYIVGLRSTVAQLKQQGGLAHATLSKE